MTEFSLSNNRSKNVVAARAAPGSGRREAMGGLAKGLSVIRAFTRERATLSLSEVAHLTSMPAATARRCLMTLEELGYVMRNGRQFPPAPESAGVGRGLYRFHEHRFPDQDALGGTGAQHG